MSEVALALVLGAAVCFGAFVLYGEWIDGKREDVRKKGGHPTTDEHGHVKDKDEDDE